MTTNASRFPRLSIANIRTASSIGRPTSGVARVVGSVVPSCPPRRGGSPSCRRGEGRVRGVRQHHSMGPATATSAHDGAVLRVVANETHCWLPMRSYDRLIKDAIRALPGRRYDLERQTWWLRLLAILGELETLICMVDGWARAQASTSSSVWRRGGKTERGSLKAGSASSRSSESYRGGQSLAGDRRGFVSRNLSRTPLI